VRYKTELEITDKMIEITHDLEKMQFNQDANQDFVKQALGEIRKLRLKLQQAGIRRALIPAEKEEEKC